MARGFLVAAMALNGFWGMYIPGLSSPWPGPCINVCKAGTENGGIWGKKSSLYFTDGMKKELTLHALLMPRL